VSIGRLSSLKTSLISGGINENVVLHSFSDVLSNVTIHITNQGLYESKVFVGIASGSINNISRSDYLIYNKEIERNGDITLSNVGIKSGDVLFCKSSKPDVGFVVQSIFDYNNSSRLGFSTFYGRENAGFTTESGFVVNNNYSIFTSKRNSLVNITVINQNVSEDCRFFVGISSYNLNDFSSKDYIIFNKKLNPREKYIIENVGVGVSQSIIVKSNKTNVSFNINSIPANQYEGLLDFSPGDPQWTTVSGGIYSLYNVGIGTTTPTNSLTVTGSGTSTSQLFVTGVSTFAGITTVTGSTLFSKQLNISGVSTFAGITTVTGSTLFAKQLNISGVSTFAGSTLFAKQLNISGVSTFAGSIFGSNLSLTGIATAMTFVGDLTGNATGLSGTPNITVDNIVASAGTFTNLTVNGTQTIINTTSLEISDKNIGIGSTSSPSDALADGAGITIYGTTNKTITWKDNSDSFTFSEGIDVKGAVETVSVGSTSNISAGKVILECDAQNGTIFTHDLTNGSVGIVSLRNFAVTKNSVTTFSILFTQNATGTANTTAITGIGTNITLTPLGVSGFSTSARVSAASTITLSTTAGDDDIVTLAIHYNGSGTGTPANYKVFATNNTGYRLGIVRP